MRKYTKVVPFFLLMLATITNMLAQDRYEFTGSNSICTYQTGRMYLKYVPDPMVYPANTPGDFVVTNTSTGATILPPSFSVIDSFPFLFLSDLDTGLYVITLSGEEIAQVDINYEELSVSFSYSVTDTAENCTLGHILQYNISSNALWIHLV